MFSSGQKSPFAFILLLLVITGCAPALSKHIRSQATPDISFSELHASVEKQEGRVVIFGGYILNTANNQDGTVLTILQAPLDSTNKPASADLSKGRFLVLSKNFLDPEIYSKGRKITVGGKVTGSRSRTLGNRDYQYPVIEALELHLWPEEDGYARPYSPYYYDPWYYPWYHPWYGYPYHHPYRHW